MELVATFFALWLATYCQDQIEDVMAYILILSLGILHGSNDMALVRKSFGMGNRLVWWRALPIYVGIVVTGILLFYYLPLISLLAFVTFSAYHFGEQHWNGRWQGGHLAMQGLYLGYGLLVFSLLFVTNFNEVSPIVYDITQVTVPLTVYKVSFIISKYLDT